MDWAWRESGRSSSIFHYFFARPLLPAPPFGIVLFFPTRTFSPRPHSPDRRHRQQPCRPQGEPYQSAGLTVCEAWGCMSGGDPQQPAGSGIVPMKSDHRRHKRSRVFMTAMLRSEFGAGEVKLTNLSSRGACADCSEDLPAGTQVQIERGDIRVPGSVAWSSDGTIGVRFDEPVDERAFRTQSQKSAAYVPTPFSTPAERISRRAELHWTEIWKSGRSQ